ncbi:MAG: ABC transporter permease [Planctomycetota bacterium]
MRKMIVVAVREYLAAVKTKAFIVSLVLMPVMMFGSIFVQILLRDKIDTADKHVAVVDHSGQLFDALALAAKERNEKDIFAERDGVQKQVQPRYLLEQAEAADADPAQILLQLSNRVRASELFAFVVIANDVVDAVADPAHATIQYYSNSPTNDDVQRWVERPTNSRIRELRLRAAKLDPEVVAAATKTVPVGNLGLVSVDASGQITKAEKTNKIANFFVPTGLMMLMFMVVMIGASPLVQSVLEEKMLRIAEVLLGSVPPFQLMMGKLLGMVGVSLTIATVYLVGAYIALQQAGFAGFFPAHVVWWFVLFQALAVLMFGALFIAIGAAVSDMKEAQNLMTPLMLVVVAPMFVWTNVVREPLSTMSTVFSLFPPATPILMVMRQAVPPGVPSWQPALGVVLVLLTTFLCVFIAGRIFRVGILMQGKGAKVGEMMRWVFRG